MVRITRLTRQIRHQATGRYAYGSRVCVSVSGITGHAINMAIRIGALFLVSALRFKISILWTD